MAKRHRKKQKQTETKPKYPDAALIRLCVTIKAELAAFNGCTDGNSVPVEPFWIRFGARANAAIEKVTTIKATTMAGLVAKAIAMQSILDDDNGGMEERSEAFYRAFADDVHRVCREQIQCDEAAARVTEAERKRAEAERKQAA